MTEFCFAPGLSLQEIENAVRALAPGLLLTKPVVVAGGPYASDARQIVFASASMLDLFGAYDLEDLATRFFSTGGPGAVRLAALAEDLPVEGPAHLETLQFARGSATFAATFLCRRIAWPQGRALFLAAAVEGYEGAGVPVLRPSSPLAAATVPDPALDLGAGATVSRPTLESDQEVSLGAAASEDEPAIAEDDVSASGSVREWTPDDQDIFDAIAASLGTPGSRRPFGPRDGATPMDVASTGPASEADPSCALLDAVPIGLVVCRGTVPIFANRFALDFLGGVELSMAFTAGCFDTIIETLPRLTLASEALELRAAGGKPVRVLASGRSIRWGSQAATLVSMQPSNATDHAAPAAPRPPQETLPDLEEAYREAERASALKSHFLAKVSHEIRTPLNAILGFAEVILEERFGPLGNQRYRAYLKDIHASGTLVMSLVNDILDLSKIEAGKFDLTLAAIDANRIVSECVSIMQPQASQERVLLRLALSPRLPRVLADERSLRQIALNLISNAVKFNQPGGQVIVATALSEAGHAVLRIKDTGIGMSEDEVAMAMEPFQQLPTVRPRSGTGLGLPLTKALVEANRASFSIKSKKHEGTLVEVAFPPAHA